MSQLESDKSLKSDSSPPSVKVHISLTAYAKKKVLFQGCEGPALSLFTFKISFHNFDGNLKKNNQSLLNQCLNVTGNDKE